MLRVAFFPNTSQWNANPYLLLLSHALAEHDVVALDVQNDFLSTRWLWAQRGQIDVLHFHWIQYHYLSAPGVASAAALAHFLRKLAWARLLGYRIVWTMHNLLPHELVPGKADWLARWGMVRLAHAVLVLCQAGRQELAERFGRRKGVYITPLGTYVDAHPSGMTKAQARTELGLQPDQFVYLYFGGVRPHKGVEQLLETFGAMPGSDLKLLVVGVPHGSDIDQRIQCLASQDDRVQAELSFIPDERVQIYMMASDVVVLPFLRVMSSSSVLAAMSFGRPVIVPTLGCLPEWVLPHCGILYDAADPDALRGALLAAQDLDLDLHEMGRAAYKRAQEFRWDVVARKTLEAYRGV
jgi:beta-1,4-mannosyltransferase